MKYALLDWDNTLRCNYTLFCWMDYLTENKIIGKEKNEDIKMLFNKYNSKHITHEQLAKLACLEYAKSIKDLDEKYLFSVSKKYNRIDRLNIYSFVPKLFEILDKNDIYPIIVSGAPMVIISNYFDEYGIKEAYGFECEVLNQKYTGKVKYNYGFNKQEIVKKIEKKMGCAPYFAIGDSESDFPMLESAKYGFLMKCRTKNKGYITINERTVLREIKCVLGINC